MIDKNKVLHILKSLNEGESLSANKTWTEAAGYHSLFAARIEKDKSIITDPNSAIPLKLFINLTTNEVKAFLAKGLDADFSTVPRGEFSSEGTAGEAKDI